MSLSQPSAKPPSGGNLEPISGGPAFSLELRDMIERAQLFSELPGEEIKVLASYVKAYRARESVTVFREGETGYALFVVVDGKIDLYKSSNGTGQRKIHTVRGGKSMGEMSLLDGLPYSASAMAAEPTILLVMTRTQWLRLAADQPVVALKVMTGLAKLLSLRLRQTTGILLDQLDN